MSILITGSLGFIGSHTCVELLNKNYNVIIVDNLSNSSISTLDNIKSITNKEPKYYNIDITNEENLVHVFRTNNIHMVIHFAAFKSVSEGVNDPLKYYHNNIIGLITLLRVMKQHNVNRIIFSSSATVYGNPKTLPITESSPLQALNPYGQTKLMGEQILRDLSRSDQSFEVVILRYFNPVGSHSSGLIGESPIGVPNNLFPYILDVINGKREELMIFGNDYDTVDGTGVRDFIHVSDLARAHVVALYYLEPGVKVYNIGTGKGYSVLEIVNKFNEVLLETGDERRVKYRFVNRREGDSASVYADTSLAYKEMGFKAELGLENMVRDSLNFLSKSLTTQSK